MQTVPKRIIPLNLARPHQWKDPLRLIDWIARLGMHVHARARQAHDEHCKQHRGKAEALRAWKRRVENETSGLCLMEQSADTSNGTQACGVHEPLLLSCALFIIKKDEKANPRHSSTKVLITERWAFGDMSTSTTLDYGAWTRFFFLYKF